MNSFKINFRAPIYWLISFVLMVIVANRGDTPDTSVYWSIFKNIDWYDTSSISKFYSETGVEIGFGWYSYILSFIVESPFIFFFLFSFFNFLILYLLIRKFEIKISLLTLMVYSSGPFYFMQQFMQMRQGLSVLLALYASIILISDSRKFLFLLFSLFALSMHQVSFVVVLFSFIYYLFSDYFLIRKKYFVSLIFVFISFLIIFFKFFIVDFAMGFSGRLEDYYNSDYNYSVGIFSLPNLKTYSIFLFVLIFSRQSMFLNKYFVFMVFLMAISVASRIGFSDFAILSGRFSTVFGFVEVILLPYVLYFLFKNKVIVYSLVILISIFQVYITLSFQAPYLIETYFKVLPN